VLSKDGGVFLGNELEWDVATNLPENYLDTRLSDDDCCSVYTIGTDDVDQLKTGRRYYTTIRTTQTTTATDTAFARPRTGTTDLDTVRISSRSTACSAGDPIPASVAIRGSTC
jgi:hypothetical protein